MTAAATRAPASPLRKRLEQGNERMCPNCGDGFAPGGRGLGKKFCSKGCTRAFHNRSKGRAALVPLALAAHGGRHAPPGSEEARLCRFARRELAALSRVLIERDRQEGRPPPSAYVAGLAEESGSQVIDRARR